MQISDIVARYVRYATRGVIFDTNIMLVYLIGLWDPPEIAKFKRTASYSVGDFDLLTYILRMVGNRLVTTPHILTEVCNLTDTINRQHNMVLYGLLAQLQTTSRERRQEASKLMNNGMFISFGIADTSLLDASKKHHLVITDEAACHAFINKNGGLVLNMNHLRSQDWLP